MCASFHSSGEEAPMKQLLRRARIWSLKVGEVHFQNSDGMESGPGDLLFLIFLRIKSSSSRVKGLRSIGGGCWTMGVRGIWVTLEGGGGSIVWTGSDRPIVRLFVLGGGGSH